MAHQTHDREALPEHVERPVQGDVFRCESCGMALKITADCHCEGESGPRLECCGKPLTRV